MPGLWTALTKSYRTQEAIEAQQRKAREKLARAVAAGAAARERHKALRPDTTLAEIRAAESEAEQHDFDARMAREEIKALDEQLSTLLHTERATKFYALAREFKNHADAVPALYQALCEGLAPLFDLKQQMISLGGPFERAAVGLPTPPLMAIDIAAIQSPSPVIRPPGDLWEFQKTATRAIKSLQDRGPK